MQKKHVIWILMFLIPILSGCGFLNDLVNPGKMITEIGEPVSFSPTETEAELKAKGVTHVQHGESAIYVGYHQVSSDNQNPIVARFDNGQLTWVREDYETNSDDGTAYGLTLGRL